jgi:hypothetical protein
MQIKSLLGRHEVLTMNHTNAVRAASGGRCAAWSTYSRAVCCGASLLLTLALTGGSVLAQAAPERGRFTIGIEERVRSDDWNNAIDMSDRTNDQRDQLRDRTRLWVITPLSGNIDFLAGAAMENIQRRGSPKLLDEVYFDQASLNFKKLFVKGLSLKIGRQDIMRGEGFVLFDGTPGDGPRSSYYNAADLSYSTGTTRIELIAILDPARDRFLPRLHDQHRLVQTWDEQAVGTYITSKKIERATLEGYYFLKKEIHDVLPKSNPQFQPDRHLSTLGGRVVYKLGPRTDWAAEYARQWGAQHGGTAIAGWGGYSWLKHTLNRRLSPYVKVGYWALSGDDPKTKGTVEGWDPLFSQWPKWSDMYVYTESKEIGIAYWSNLSMSQVEAGFAPVRKTSVALIWYHMDSFHPFAGDTRTFGTGMHRGENLQARVEYSPNPSWKAYIHYESHRPNDFYADTRAPAYEVQAQVTYQFLFHPFEGPSK